MESQNKSTLIKCIQVHTDTSARPHALTLALVSPPIHPTLCVVKSLTPAVVVSWFKGSVITNGDELACECQKHRVGGQSRDGPWRGKPDLP